MIFVSETRDGERVEYRDTKRYLWVFSLIVPTYTLAAIGWYVFVEPLPWIAFVPIFLSFVVTPVLDMIVGEDRNNPPEEVVEQMAEDEYYRVLLHVSVVFYWAAFLAAAWFVGTQDLPIWGAIAMTVAAGFSSGTAITVGHELGHKTNTIDKWGAKLALAISGYAHFCIEHNKGHHTWVATPEDPASARFGESVYGFAWREIPGTFMRGIGHERERLARKSLPFWSVKNDVVQGWAITGVVALVLIAAFGWVMVPFILLHHFAAWYQLTQANYIEHYGLKRAKKANGRYEPVQPKHSWNTNHMVSNLMLFHLQRHSDHHANPMRPYQSLRNFDDIPRLPSGYPGSFVLAAVPWLWWRVMNPKVMAWAEGDMDRVNTGQV